MLSRVFIRRNPLHEIVFGSKQIILSNTQKHLRQANAKQQKLLSNVFRKKSCS